MNSCILFLMYIICIMLLMYICIIFPNVYYFANMSQLLSMTHYYLGCFSQFSAFCGAATTGAVPTGTATTQQSMH